jgi:hypothetical protein
LVFGLGGVCRGGLGGGGGGAHTHTHRNISLWWLRFVWVLLNCRQIFLKFYSCLGCRLTWYLHFIVSFRFKLHYVAAEVKGHAVQDHPGDSIHFSGISSLAIERKFSLLDFRRQSRKSCSKDTRIRNRWALTSIWSWSTLRDSFYRLNNNNNNKGLGATISLS